MPVANQRLTCSRCGRAFAGEPGAGSLCPVCDPTVVLLPEQKGVDPADPLLGQALGQFEILELIGRGTMGAVYKAHQVSLARLVAVKVLSEALAADPKFVAHFERQARATAAVNHPNVIAVIEVGEEHGRRYVAMEYVDGESLAALLEREGRVAPARAASLLEQSAAALAAAHHAGVIHYDVKPSNILVDSRGEVRLTDFGMARGGEPGTTTSARGHALGAAAYAPPEVATGQPLDARADLYSLGATFFHALAGRPPFEGDDPAAVLLRQATEEAPSLSDLAPDVDRRIVVLIHRLLEKDPGKRPASARALLEEIEELDRSLNPPTTPGRGTADVNASTVAQSDATLRRAISRPAPPLRWGKRPWVAAALCLACVGMVVAGLLLSGPSHRGETPPVSEPPDEPPPPPPAPNVVVAPRPPDKPSPPVVPTAAQVEAALRADNPGYAGTAELVLRDGKITEIDLRQRGIRHLGALKGLSLTKLKCDRNQIADLSPLRGMPLAELVCGENQIGDLSPLAGLPLTFLMCHSNHITDLGPIRGLPLRSLFASRNGIRDLSPLRGMPLTRLCCCDCQVADLSPLQGMPLALLHLYRNPVSDLQALKGMPLTELEIGWSKVADLSPLRGMPLRKLGASGLDIADLSVLLDLPLEALAFSPDRVKGDLGPLRRHKTLGFLGAGVHSRDAKTPAAAFWNTWDARGQRDLLPKP